MSPELFEKVNELLDSVEHLPPTERIEFVRRADVSDEVRREAMVILEHLPTAGSAYFDAPSNTTAEPPLGSLIGCRLGDFVIQSEIGRGGMGVVYRATQEGLSRIVALKVLDSRSIVSGDTRERFRRESIIAARLVHESIVPVFASGETDGVLWYAMQFVHGCSLRQLLDQRGDPLIQARFDNLEARLTWALQIADALAFCHDRGVLHRDVKPENILIARDDLTARLADFGLAKVDGLDPLSRDGDFGGTLSYMSREQLRLGLIGLDGRSDVYSLGVVLFEIIAGRKPIEGRMPAEMLTAIDSRRLTKLRSVVPSVAPALATLVEKALEPLPEHRYAGAAELRDDLGRYLAGKSIDARPPGLLRRCEAWLERHSLVGSIVLTVLATLAAVWVGASLSRGTALTPRPALAQSDRPVPAWLRIHLPESDHAHRVAWARRRIDVPGWIGVQDFVSTTERVVTVLLEAGEYAITVVDANGRFAEDRVLVAEGESEAELRPRLLPNEIVHRDMVRIDGGHTSVVAELAAALVPSKRRTRRDFSTTSTYVAPFWIDVAPVTIGDYRRFLAEHGREAPTSWSNHRGWLDAWRASPRQDFDALPMVGLSWSEVVEYASWLGKRLPTAAEWQIITQRTPAVELDAMRSDPTSYGLRSMDSRVIDESLASFLTMTLPVSSARPRSLHGLIDSFGNVRQWLDDPLLPIHPGTAVMRRSHGGCWLDSLDEVVQEGRLMPRFLGSPTPSAGFRCAKSADPTAVPGL
ncbi:MAG: bifunctional serine/threonine-protein kinase/formylglycine-generating enzyme family protein [Planctomycetota bacterium]